MARYKTVVSPEGQSQVEITGDELTALEAAEAAAEAGRVDRAMREMRDPVSYTRLTLPTSDLV